jgi:hypothetical protein
VQAVAKLIDEPEITVRIREEDLVVAKEAISLAQQELAKYKKTNKLTLDTTSFLPPSKHNVEGLATWYAVSSVSFLLSFSFFFFLSFFLSFLLSFFSSTFVPGVIFCFFYSGCLCILWI